MKLDRIGSSQSTALRRASHAAGAGGTGFAEQLESEAPAEGAAPLAPLGGVEGLLALQEVGEDGGRRRRPSARGHAVLDQLEEIRRGLLLGSIPRAELERLERLAAGMREDVADPRLAEILAEIELRAKVELAKLVAAP
jgi:hypothetical protein